MIVGGTSPLSQLQFMQSKLHLHVLDQFWKVGHGLAPNSPICFALLSKRRIYFSDGGHDHASRISSFARVSRTRFAAGSFKHCPSSTHAEYHAFARCTAMAVKEFTSPGEVIFVTDSSTIVAGFPHWLGRTSCFTAINRKLSSTSPSERGASVSIRWCPSHVNDDRNVWTY